MRDLYSFLLLSVNVLLFLVSWQSYFALCSYFSRCYRQMQQEIGFNLLRFFHSKLESLSLLYCFHFSFASLFWLTPVFSFLFLIRSFLFLLVITTYHILLVFLSFFPVFPFLFPSFPLSKTDYDRDVIMQ